MCFNTTSSLTAWLFANTIAVYLFLRNQNYDRWNAIFIFTFTLIQLLEAGIWRNLDNYWNSYLTATILIAILVQPLVQSYLGYKYTGAYPLLILTILLSIILVISILRIIFSNISHFITYVGKNGHLVWTDSTNPIFIGNNIILIIYLIGLLVPLLFMEQYKGWPLLIVAIITALWSWYNSKNNEFSSLWCYTAIIYSLVALFI